MKTRVFYLIFFVTFGLKSSELFMNNLFGQNKLIISASRRTDIPAFYSDWLRKQLERGYVVVSNPFNRKSKLVDLRPERVAGFVFWTRFPANLVKHLDYIDAHYGPHHYINLTITNYPKVLEPASPNLLRLVTSIDVLAQRYGENYIKWRFDPIIISTITPKEWILETFYTLCQKLSGRIRTCTTSFVDFYTKVTKNFSSLQNRHRIQVFDIELDEKVELIQQLQQISKSFGIELQLCCEREVSIYSRCLESRCVNTVDLALDNRNGYRAKPSRNQCNCIESVDIGFYDSCLFGCVYCYANADYKKSVDNYRKFKKVGFCF